ncbi:hypothetical protein ABT354_18575 [Streptomyces sp. NPDC000594]|uniref:hypothetical protein n=1 Tax=Streptomyces sp. NPDC000594 TaxID=3154261 RepID=UPI003327EC97
MIRSIRSQRAAALAAAVCALSVPLTVAVPASAAPSRATATAAGEVDRNLLKPPPGGVLAPATDLLGQLGLVPKA